MFNEKRQFSCANNFASVIMQHLLRPLEWTAIGPQWKPSAIATGQLSHPVISVSKELLHCGGCSSKRRVGKVMVISFHVSTIVSSELFILSILFRCYSAVGECLSKR